jgi:hypothetical protein
MLNGVFLRLAGCCSRISEHLSVQCLKYQMRPDSAQFKVVRHSTFIGRSARGARRAWRFTSSFGTDCLRREVRNVLFELLLCRPLRLEFLRPEMERNAAKTSPHELSDLLLQHAREADCFSVSFLKCSSTTSR